ncbi:MAG: hypothetical protein OEW62_00755 [Candidatus Bathyarchaeota archaeon]|nr:hypothetical protein [Candidatus Bathyarchaeota archaeon]MDH5745423.1 hypothetical protein [Candidatus Bathyarchaeota archaeon]
MSNKAILRRLKKLEKVFAVEPKDEWLDILMWNGSEGGIFGHTHCRISLGGNRTEWIPCSDEEELEIMREHYEREGHRVYGKGAEVSFAEYLERFSYLGSEELTVRREAIIERLKGEEDGVRVEDTGCRTC